MNVYIEGNQMKSNIFISSENNQTLEKWVEENEGEPPHATNNIYIYLVLRLWGLILLINKVLKKFQVICLTSYFGLQIICKYLSFEKIPIKLCK